MLGWAGLRGATPIVFATFPVTEGIPHGDLIFQVAFFVVLLSTILQGLTIEPVARWLGVTSDEAAIPAPLVEPVILEPAGRGDDAVPGPRRRRDRGPSGARARPPARGAAERDRARRAGDPAARLDDHPGRRPAARARAPGGRGRVPRADAALADRAGRPAGAPAPPAAQPPVGHDDPARGRTATAIRSARSELSGNEVIEQLRTRRDEPGALVAARGRPLRASAGRCWRSGRPASCRRSPAGACQRLQRPASAPGGRRSSARWRAKRHGDELAGRRARCRRASASAVATMNSDAETERAEAEPAMYGTLAPALTPAVTPREPSGVHDDDRPVAGLDVPGQRARALGDPDVAARRAGRAGACRGGWRTWR